MIRVLIVLVLWIASLGMASIDMRWSDGLSVHLVGWLDVILKRHKARHDASGEGDK